MSPPCTTTPMMPTSPKSLPMSAGRIAYDLSAKSVKVLSMRAKLKT